MAGAGPARRVSAGRPQSTSHGELEHAAFALFAERGFEATSVEEIAAAVGIGRRTFFRYFASKNDVVWGDFDGGLQAMRARLDGFPASVPLLQAVRAAALDFNTIDPAEEAWHRQRMSLILTVPTLYANSALRFAQWRRVIAEYAAERLGLEPDDLTPTLVGYCALGASLTAYERWLAEPGSRLETLLDESFGRLAHGLNAVPGMAS